MGARIAGLIAGLWAGVLVAVGAIAAPAAFAILPSADAGRAVGRMFAIDAYVSLAVAIVLFVIERQRSRSAAAAGTGSVFSANLVLLFGTLFCTVAGYFAILPLMAAARAGQGSLSFAALHGVSAGLFVLKGLLVLALAWRLSLIRPAAPTS
jgi:cyanophycinase-like exopeptidase